MHLTDAITDNELAVRGVAIPELPEAPDNPPGRPQSLRAHCEKQPSLASAYWLIEVLGGVFSLLFNLLDSAQAVLLTGCNSGRITNSRPTSSRA